MKPIRVAIVSQVVPQYRRPFFEALRDRLAQDHIELLTVAAESSGALEKRYGAGILPGTCIVAPRRLKIRGRELVWYPALGLLRGTDLVIVEQASKLLLNYVLQLWSWIGGPKLAFWGHGRNLQGSTASKCGEAIKRIASRRADWWFAYTEVSAAIVRDLGFPPERITCVQNAIDSRALLEQRATITAGESAQLREALGLDGDNVCVYAGGLYPEKRLDLLFEACARVRAAVKGFELVVLGGGEDSPVAVAAARKWPWVKYVGPRFGREKVLYFSLAKLLLIPAAVGLAILDSFVLETPLITVGGADHGPEIAYLRDGENGILVKDANPESYASAIAEVLRDAKRLELLRAGCRRAAEQYTIEDMVERFAVGVRCALGKESMNETELQR